MSLHMNQLANEDPSIAQQDTAQVVDQPPSLSPPIMQNPAQMPATETKDTTSTSPSPTAIVAFLLSMKSHYDTLSDPVTPHLFTQLCKDYNTSKSDETSFYVAAYRLFFETNATHLVPGLRAFLPTTWREVDMEWLDKAVEGDSERQRASAREVVGELAAMVESGITEPMTPSGSAVATKKLDLGTSATQSAKNKKRAPLNGFRASYRTDLETPLRSRVPTPSSNSDKNSRYQTPLGPSPSPASSRQTKTKTSVSPPTKTKTKNLPLQKKKRAPSPTSASETQGTPTPTPSTPLAPTTDKQSNSNLPPASSIPHLGPIYPTTRAIIARSHKPYIHALCGMGFGHPAEVQRHHNGQGGRPGCWEKSRKPEGEEGRWDRDGSCRVRLADVRYVRVQEGWVVTSWGSTVVERVLSEGAGEDLKGGTSKLGIVKTGEGKKRKAGAKLQRAPKVETHAASEDEDESASEEGEEVDKYTEPLSPQEPGAKRQKVSKVEENTASGSDEHAAVRAAALGLRTRK